MAVDTTSKDVKATAPMYASYRVFTGFLDWLGEQPQIPEQLDRSVAGDRYSGSLWSHLVSGLQFLGLTRGTVPEPELEELVNANQEKRKTLIEAMLRRAYGDEFINRVPRITPHNFDKHLDELGTTSATRQKAASFLTNALKDTDVEIPPGIAKRARNKGTTTSRRSNKSRNSQPLAEPEVLERPTADPHSADSSSEKPQIQRTCELGEGVVAMLTVRGDILKMANAADKMVWLQAVITEFDKGAEEPERHER